MKNRIFRCLRWMAICFSALILVSISISASADSVERWDHIEYIWNNELGGASGSAKDEKPYDAIYLADDGYAYYSTSGGRAAISRKDGNVFLGSSTNPYTVSGEYVYLYSYSPFTQNTYARHTGPFAFKASINVSTTNFVTREEITFTGHATGGVAPYANEIFVLNADTGAQIRPKLTDEGSALYIFDKPGNYYAFSTAVDANLDRSDFAIYPFTITEGLTTTAKVSSGTFNCGASYYNAAVNEPLRWTITASGGEGELTYFVYLERDGKFVSRYECTGNTGEAMITEKGKYRVYARVRDEATGGYSDLVSIGLITVGDQFTYEITTDENGNSGAKLTKYNGHLENLVIPSSVDGVPVVEIGRSFLNYTTDHSPCVKNIKVSEGVKTIGDSAFVNGSRNLIGIQLPSTIQTIGAGAFSGNRNLSSLIMPSAESIGDQAFTGCNSLTEITLPANLKTLGKGVFKSSYYLTTVNLPYGLTTIGEEAFYDAGITSLSLPDTVVEIGKNAFDSSSSQANYGRPCPRISLTYVKWTAGIPVFETGDFNGCKALETVILPEGVTEIGYQAFNGCSALKNVSMPSTLVTIGEKAFSNCSGLKSLTLSEGVKTIGSNAFAQCSALESVKLGANVETLGQYAFDRCNKLTSIELNDGLKTIERGALESTSLTRLEIPDSVTTFNMDISTGNTSHKLHNTLQYLKWTAGIPVFETKEFNYFKALETVVLPEGVTEIGYQAFNGCSALKNVSMPSTLVKIGNSSFQSTALGRVYLPVGIEQIGTSVVPEGAVLVCMSGSTTKATLDAAKIACEEPSVLTLPENTRTIEEQAFIGSAAEMIIIPSGCTSIGSQAFAQMDNLHYVVMPDSVSSVAADAFSGSPVLYIGK